jgi:hypothetical protein
MWRSIYVWFAYRLGLDPRGLFAFWDGWRWRYADPLAVARVLWSVPDFDSGKSRELIASESGTLVVQGYAEIGRVVRHAFQVRPAEQGGLTDLECETLLARFEHYLGDLKKNGRPGQTSAQFTVPRPSLDSLTNPELDCGSTAIDSSSESPLL